MARKVLRFGLKLGVINKANEKSVQNTCLLIIACIVIS